MSSLMCSGTSGSITDITGEVEECARRMFVELTRGTPRREPWYLWYLCERHGGPPLIDPNMPARQVAFWDGDDIVIAASAPLPAIIEALPEELAHRLSGADAPRFEPLNYLLRRAHYLSRADFQERVGQRVAQLFARGQGTKGTIKDVTESKPATTQQSPASHER